MPTWRCREAEQLAYVLDHLEELVVKEVHGSGGYGMLIGPMADKAQIAAFRTKLKLNPQGLHRAADVGAIDLPDLRRGGRRAAPRRPAAVRAQGRDRVRIVPGGLTRVALKAGSLVVNSSQGGGTKDTWVLDR